MSDGKVLLVIVAVALVAIAALGALAWLLLKSRIALAEAEAQRRGQDELNQSLARELAAQRDSLRSEFAKLAADLLGDKQGALSKANEESLRLLFGSLKDRLDKYGREVESSARSNREMGVEMRAHVDSLQKFAAEARSFTAALIGGNKIQGNKGEDILANLLEKSGLQKGVHYDAQLGAHDEGRPDVSIYDVRNHHVILIDSKMNIKDYIVACNLPDDAAHKEEKARALRAHVASIRRQVDNLSSKDYANTVTPKEGYSNLPLVAMFCPFDTVLEAALIADPALVQYAYEKNIVFVTPLTLWGYLWLVSWGWKQREVERRYDEIQALGRDVVAAVDSMLGDLETMGASLAKAQSSYDGLYKRATAEKGQVSVRRVAMKLLDYGITPKGNLKQLSRPIAMLAVVAAFVVALPRVSLGAGSGMIVLQTGSDWCESGEDVRKVFESSAFRRALRRGGYELAVYDDMERPTPKVAAANRALENLFVRSSRLPAISFLSPAPHRFFALIENIPYNITPQELSKQVNDALASRKEAEALFRLGARLRGPNPQGAANAYGAGFEILAAHAGDLNEGRTRKGGFAYESEWNELLKLDAGDRFGWRMRFEAGYGFGIVEKANKLRGSGNEEERKRYIASLRAIPTNSLTVVLRQCIEMAEYAVVRDGEDSARAETLLKRAFDMGRDTVWGQCAMGYLILSGTDIERKPPYRAKVRPRPAPESQVRFVSANSLLKRLAQIGAADELTEEQKTDIARYAVLRRIGIDQLNELVDRPGAWPFVAAFLKDRLWMEDLAWSGQCPSRALFALESLVYQDCKRWIAGDGPGRRFATAVALEYPDSDEEWLADYLDAYRETAKAKRLHRHALTQPVWQWRYVVARRGSIDVDDPPNQQRFMDKFCNMNVVRSGGAIWFVPYRLFNCFGASVHSHEYYEPWVTAGEWPKRKYSYIVGGVCGELSTFASICSVAHGLPAIPCGQPGHCAFTRRLLDGTWRIDNYIAPPTTMRSFWPDGGKWTYLQANEGSFEGDREKRHDADRFSEMAHFAARKDRPAAEVAAFYARACRAWPTHYGAWSAWGNWIVNAGRPLGEHRDFVRAAVAAMKGWRQPLWDLLTPYFDRVTEEKGAVGLAAALVEFAPALRQGDVKIQEEGDFRAMVAKWAEPLVENQTLMGEVSMAILTAQGGTRNYFAQVLAWCGDFIIDDEKRLAKLLDLAGKTAKSKKKKGADAPAKSFLEPLILSAAANGNISVFRRLSALQDKMTKYKPTGKRYSSHDFDAELISIYGMLRTSSSPVGDTPGSHAHALDGRPITGNAFRTEKETAPWAMVMLPKPAVVKGVVVVNAGKDAKLHAQQAPVEVELSEDGQNWQTVFFETEVRETYRVDLVKNKSKYLCVRVRRSPDAQNAPFTLAKILVYGKK